MNSIKHAAYLLRQMDTPKRRVLLFTMPITLGGGLALLLDHELVHMEGIGSDTMLVLDDTRSIDEIIMELSL